MIFDIPTLIASLSEGMTLRTSPLLVVRSLTRATIRASSR
ncbi:MAG: hypothetical protein AAF282_04825 [Cyanobacteria bacterium P01_A01_bin.15]